MALVIPPRSQDIGFPVKRLLPSRLQQRVGPFIFLDHMGPATFPAATTRGDVRPHPHIGLATVTYLLEGAMMHRDSLGNVQRIEPGAINLMTAGKGIVHSERIPEDIRNGAIALQGIQTWLALPSAYEEVSPDFQHYSASEIPCYVSGKVTANVLIGDAFGLISPVKTPSPTTFLHIKIQAHGAYEHKSAAQELAIYILSGSLQVNNELVLENNLIVFAQGEDFMVRTQDTGCSMLILGGEPLAGERYILWNFVASSKEKLRAASERWVRQDFDKISGETEWIPLPE